jgi:toxin ParE1/3/4
LVLHLYEAPAALVSIPFRGRPGKKEGTRELVLSPLPYIVVYRITDDAIHIVRILHGAQKWP